MRNTRRCSGQAAVMSALFLCVAVLFLMLSVNTGILVTDKIRTQNTADLSAYSAAYQQAATMNQIARLSKQIYIRTQELRYTLNMGPYGKGMYYNAIWGAYIWNQPQCSCTEYSPQAEQVIEDAQADIANLITQIQSLNQQGAINARKAAQLTAKRNLMALKTLGSVGFFEQVNGSPGAASEVVPLTQVTETELGYSYYKRCCCEDTVLKLPKTRFLNIPTWVYKGNATVYMPVKVKYASETHFIGREFYQEQEGSLTTQNHTFTYGYAVAKPYEGILGTRNPDNQTALIATGGVPTDVQPFHYWLYPPSTELMDYFQATYRARMAGFHEDMGDGTNAAALVAADVQEPQFQSKTAFLAH